MTPQARASAARKAWTTFYGHMLALKEEGYAVKGFMNRRETGYGRTAVMNRRACALDILLVDLSISKTIKEKL